MKNKYINYVVNETRRQKKSENFKSNNGSLKVERNQKGGMRSSEKAWGEMIPQQIWKL